ncbi:MULTISPECIES: hypothetical protein [unclassified Bradyrhizobium]|uniref:hypothetical protein n=1 Tax=unclassified Bradyrhizobium TaxID=2631580 RepID=UPI0004188BFB|nr:MULTISPECIES: hypothetical protein [unclassified Bradyrhizobium]QIG94647.1 toxin-antitoxin system HicB family antitoxin [Bradyrhizobium sp. 6(2017)]
MCPDASEPKGPGKEPILLRQPLLEILDRLAAAEFCSHQGQIEKRLHEALVRRGAWPPKAEQEDSSEDEAH